MEKVRIRQELGPQGAAVAEPHRFRLIMIFPHHLITFTSLSQPKLQINAWPVGPRIVPHGILKIIDKTEDKGMQFGNKGGGGLFWETKNKWYWKGESFSNRTYKQWNK